MARKRTGIILAWDRDTFKSKDVDLLDSLMEHVDMVKVGLRAMNRFDPAFGASIAECVRSWMSEKREKTVMWDAKFFDIGTTVDKAIRDIVNRADNIRFLTVHATMSDNALHLANTSCAQANVTALAVTVLTDIDEAQCRLRFGRSPPDAVAHLARNAQKQGIRGFVCSPLEIRILRETLGHDAVLVVPGVRPAWALTNDQKRVAAPAEAAKAGADYIVVGRPILEPPSGMTPVESAKRVREVLDEALATA